MKLDPVETLAQLVATASVNPMGRAANGPPFFEERLTEHLEKTLRQLGLVVERQRVAPGRENLIARLDGELPLDRGGRLILLDAHQDTVPVCSTTGEAFRPQLRGGRLYGRGACDTKGGMAAMLSAVSRLAAERPRGMSTVLLCFTVDEEYGFSGVRAITPLCQKPSALIPRRPDVAVIAEPTGLDIVVAHKGVVRWRCHTQGKAAHASRPEEGENAIYRMGRALGALERFAQQEVARLPSHPLCGPATLNVGTIQGGLSVNTVPDRCTIEIDCRFIPGEQPAETRRAVVEYLDNAGLGFALEHDPPFMQGPALADEGNAALSEALERCVRELLGRSRRIGVPYASHAAFYAAAGVPAVVCGPGSVAQAHTEDEWVDIEQVRQAAEIYYRFCLRRQ